jgi:septation ring formation regulator EzrA
MGAGIARLQEHNRTLEQQLQTVQTHLVLPEEAQHSLVSRLQQTLQETRQELLAIQDANLRLEQRLHEKRLLLETKGKALDQVAEREARLYAAITELRRDKARLAHEATDLQNKLAQRDTDFERVRKQFNTLSQEHESFVGKYHQLFQAYNRQQRSKQKT